MNLIVRSHLLTTNATTEFAKKLTIIPMLALPRQWKTLSVMRMMTDVLKMIIVNRAFVKKEQKLTALKKTTIAMTENVSQPATTHPNA